MKARRIVASALCVAVTGCASAPAGSVDPDALRGCWIERRGDQTITHRWFPEPGSWRGDDLTYFPKGDPEPRRWKLKSGGEAAPWSMCVVELNMMSAPPCWRAFFGPGKADGENTQWVEIEADSETLKITYVTDQYRAVSFNGRRDGCD